LVDFGTVVVVVELVVVVGATVVVVVFGAVDVVVEPDVVEVDFGTVVVVVELVVVVVVPVPGAVNGLAAQRTGRKNSWAVLPIAFRTVIGFFTPGSWTTILLPWVPMLGFERPSPFARACMIPTTVWSSAGDAFWVGWKTT